MIIDGREAASIVRNLLKVSPWELRCGEIAQLVEQRTENPCVPGSIPGLATTFSRSGKNASAQFAGAQTKTGIRPPTTRHHDVSLLCNFQIAALDGLTLGLATADTVFIDANAAGWGWFVDATPHDSSEFSDPDGEGV